MRKRKPKTTVKLPTHVQKVTSRGKVYYYYQPKRGTEHKAKAVRIHGEPTDPDWWAEYSRVARLPAPKVSTNTMSAVIEAWHKSPEWAKMSEGSKSLWSGCCGRLIEVWGEIDIARIEPKHVLALRDDLAHKPGSANNLLYCLSALIAWSIPRGYRASNPCREVKNLPKGEGHKPWPWWAVERAQQELRPDLWHVAALAVYTGQRQSDVVAMKWPEDDFIFTKQKKTGKELFIPIHSELKAILADIPRCAETICTNTRGEVWNLRSFSTTWYKYAPKFLKEHGLVFHGLRKTAVVTLLEAGCTDAQVASITGQSRDMVEHYSRRVNQKKLARTAIDMWEAENTKANAAL